MEKINAVLCKWNTVALECSIEQSIHELNAHEEIHAIIPQNFEQQDVIDNVQQGI